MSLLLLALLYTSALAAEHDPCHWGRFDLLSKNDVVECLETVKWDNSLSKELHGSLESYLEMHAFTPELLSPPKDYRWMAHDQITELERLKTKASKSSEEEGSYTCEYEAYEDLVRLFRKSKDPNMFLTLPNCYEDILFFQLVRPIPKLVDGKTTMTFAFLDENAIHPYELYIQKYPDERYKHTDILVALQGQEIKSINGKDPFEYYFEFGKRLNLSRDIGTLVNAALLGHGRRGTLGDGFPSDNEVVYTVVTEEGNLIELPIPYIYLPTHKVDSAVEFADMCHGLVPTKEEDNEIPAYFMLNVKRDFELPRYQVVNTRVKGELEELARKLGEEDGLTMLNIRAQIRERHVANIDAFVETSKFALLDFADFGREFWIQHYGSSDGVVTVLRIPGPVTKDFIADEMMKDILETVTKGQRLVIDLRGNTGKVPSIDYEYDGSKDNARFRPVTTKWRFKNNRTFANLVEKGVLGGDAPINSYLTKPTDELIGTKNTTSYNNSVSKPHLVFSVQYTPFFTLGKTSFVDNWGIQHMFTYDEFVRRLRLDRTEVVVVTDGLCGSSCAAFVSYLAETFSAKVLTVGGYKSDFRSIGPSLVSYSGEMVATSAGIINRMSAKGLNPGHDGLPQTLPFGFNLHFPIGKSYSIFNDERPSGFSKLQPSHHEFWYGNGNPEKSADKDYPELLDVIWKYLDKHTISDSGSKKLEAKVTDVPCKSDGKEVHGHLWDKDKNGYLGECVFLHCIRGYHQTKVDGPCVPIPFGGDNSLEAWEPIEIQNKFEVGAIAISVMSALVVLRLCLLMCRRK